METVFKVSAYLRFVLFEIAFRLCIQLIKVDHVIINIAWREGNFIYIFHAGLPSRGFFLSPLLILAADFLLFPPLLETQFRNDSSELMHDVTAPE